MKIQVLSDVHTDHHLDGGQLFVSLLDPTDIDVLVVAGDIGTRNGIAPALKMLCDKYPHVVYTPGNHEYYERTWGHVDKVLNLATRIPNLHILRDSSVEINGQRFIGCTLWFPWSEACETHALSMNDFNYIQGFVFEVYDRNSASVKYLWDNVQKGDVVVTHHMPTPKATPPRFATSPLNAFFVCNMEDLIQARSPAAWVFGHTHNNYEGQIGETRLVCNPFGYIWGVPANKPQENPAFDWKKVISL